MPKLLPLLAILLGVPFAEARRLTVRTYTTADGLARDNIRCVLQDSRGFIWFCTAEGLSRFDGYQFTNYYTAQGLAANPIEDLLETRSGVYWVATGGGLCRFDAAGKSGALFQCLPVRGPGGVPAPAVLYEDRRGGVWCGTNSSRDGLFYLPPAAKEFRREPFPMAEPSVSAILEDRAGALWVGTSGGWLYRRDRSGQVRRFGREEGIPNGFIMALAEDRDGGLWVGTRDGLARMENPSASRPALRVFSR